MVCVKWSVGKHIFLVLADAGQVARHSLWVTSNTTLPQRCKKDQSSSTKGKDPLRGEV